MNIVKNSETVPRRRGRPPAFDRNAVLAKATEAFWQLGYEGASIADLTAAMGLTPQSLYAAFTSKADLYRAALAWYQANIAASTGQLLEDEADVVEAFARLLYDCAATFTRADRPKGCMISTATLACAVEHDPLARHAAGLRAATLDVFRARIARGVAEGQLRPDIDTEALARFIGAMIQGMSIQARDGATAKELLALVAHAVAEIGRHRMDQQAG